MRSRGGAHFRDPAGDDVTAFLREQEEWSQCVLRDIGRERRPVPPPGWGSTDEVAAEWRGRFVHFGGEADGPEPALVALEQILSPALSPTVRSASPTPAAAPPPPLPQPQPVAPSAAGRHRSRQKAARLTEALRRERDATAALRGEAEAAEAAAAAAAQRAATVRRQVEFLERQLAEQAAREAAATDSRARSQPSAGDAEVLDVMRRLQLSPRRDGQLSSLSTDSTAGASDTRDFSSPCASPGRPQSDPEL